MKKQYISYSRSAYVFLALICITMTAYSQPIQVDYVSSYFGEGGTFFIQDVVYAEPYYAVIGRDGNTPQVRYYAYANGAVSEAFRITPFEDDPLNQKRVIWSKANATVTVLVLADAESQDLVWVRHVDGEHATILQEKIESDVNLSEFAFDDHAFHAISTGFDSTLVSMSFGEEYLSVKQFTNTVSLSGFSASNLGYAAGEILIVDGAGNEEDEYNGVVRAKLDEGGELVINETAFYPIENAQIVHGVSTRSPLALFFYSGQAVIWQWSDDGEPVRLFSGSVPRSGFSSTMTAESVAMNLSSDGKYHILTLQDGTFSDIAQIPGAYRSIALGPELFIQYGPGKLIVYDITDGASLTLIEFPIEEAETIDEVEAAGDFLYIRANDRMKTLNVSDRTSPQFVSDDGEIYVMENHPPFLAVYSPGIERLKNGVYNTVNPDGSLGEQQLAPVLPENIDHDGILQPIWNEKVFIQPAKFIDGSISHSFKNNFPKLFLYEINAGQISDATASVIDMPLNGDSYALFDDKIYVSSFEQIQPDDFFLPPYFILYFHVYTIGDLANPQLIAQASFETEDPSAWANRTLSVEENWLALAIQSGFYLINADDAALTTNNPTTYSPGEQIWSKGYLFVNEFGRGVTVYQPSEGGLIEVGFFPIIEVWDMDIKDDYLYAAHRDRGLDIFKLTFDETNVHDWALY
ncbi:MAG: hypothetical protein P9L94_05860 [Candidatus Hinthialibacter antarcticus]|nr:hypothetical protein [Candidatus Hinthialibacter antarcticus]